MAAATQLSIRVNGQDPTFRIATERISARLLKPIDDLLLDLLDVAAAVFAADSTIARGGATRAEFGAAWRRRFDFTIPVRRPDVWSQDKVGTALTDAVSFLTEDDVSFSFVEAQGSAPEQQYFDFDPGADPANQIDEVILFSGGLDSLAGALERLSTGTGRVALVTHLSAQKLHPHQMRLARELVARFPGRVLHVPVSATRVGEVARETTQRSRSLLFAALGHVIARMLGARRISFYENGVVSQNLPISPQIIGTMATRTTHPLTLHKLAAFLDTLGDAPIPVENHFSNLTKTDVVRILADHGGADLIKDSVSCTSVHNQDLLHTHCGACSQCLDRRFAILAAGLEHHENDEMYETDVLFGARPSDRSRTLALDWTAHACRLAEMSFADFTQRFISELTRIIAGHPLAPELQTAKAAQALQQRHGQAVRSVLQRSLEASAARLLDGALPETSLLRLYVARQTGGPQLPSTMAHESTSPGFAPDPLDLDGADFAPTSIFPLQVAFDHQAGKDRIHVRGLGAVHGSPASVAHVLKVTYDQDLAAGRNLDGHRFVHPHLARNDGTGTKDNARRQVARCRAELAEYYHAIEGRPPAKPLLIENKSRQGYRLDPTCKVISPTEIP